MTALESCEGPGGLWFEQRPYALSWKGKAQRALEIKQKSNLGG